MVDEYKYEYPCLNFSMPYGEILKIVRLSKKDLEDDGFFPDEEMDGVIYVIRLGSIELPWTSKTQFGAACIALGCQWGARQMFNIRYEKND